MEEIKKQKNKKKCENCEWYISTLNDNYSHCLLTLKKVSPSEKCDKCKEYIEFKKELENRHEKEDKQ